jgi:hypothetical protein
VIAGEEPLLWPPRPPVDAQGFQQLGREHYVAVFLRLCVRRIYVAVAR